MNQINILFRQASPRYRGIVGSVPEVWVVKNKSIYY